MFHLGCSSTKIWWRPGNHSNGTKASIWAGEVNISETSSRPNQTSKIKLFAKTVFAKSSNLKVWLGYEYGAGFVENIKLKRFCIITLMHVL